MAWDMSEYVIVVDPSACCIELAAELAAEASVIESDAMRLDFKGNSATAAESYRKAASKLREASDVCPVGHSDRNVLEQHAHEVLIRAEYLAGLGATPPTVPLNKHISGVQLSLGRSARQPRIPVPNARNFERATTTVMGAAAAITGTTGLLTLGPLAGVAVCAATAYAATCKDHKAGAAARKVGHMGIELVGKASRLNREHKIGVRFASAALSSVKNMMPLKKIARESPWHILFSP